MVFGSMATIWTRPQIMLHLEFLKYILYPGLLIVHIPEELMQAVGLIQLCTASSCHALDPLEALINSVSLLLYLGGVKSTAGHQAVSLAIQVLQAILES